MEEGPTPLAPRSGRELQGRGTLAGKETGTLPFWLTGAEAEELRTGKPRTQPSGPSKQALEAEVEDLTFERDRLEGELAEAKRQLDTIRNDQNGSSPEATSVHDPGLAGAPAGGTAPHSLIVALRENGPLNESDLEALLDMMEKMLSPEQRLRALARMSPTGRDGTTTRAASWIKETLAAKGPMPTADFEILAKGDGVYASRNTFDRARKIAGVQTGRRGKAWWVWLKGQDPPGGDDPAGSVE
jgi:hypothetical protein